MSCLRCLISVLPQIEVAFTVFFWVDSQIVVQEVEKMPFQSIDLECCVGSDDLGKRMILQTLVVPYLWRLDQSHQDQIFPVPITNFVLLAGVEHPLYVNIRYNWRLFLHLASHHHQLDKVFYVLSTARPHCLIPVLVVKTGKIISNRLDLLVKKILALLKGSSRSLRVIYRLGVIHFTG